MNQNEQHEIEMRLKTAGMSLDAEARFVGELIGDEQCASRLRAIIVDLISIADGLGMREVHESLSQARRDWPTIPFDAWGDPIDAEDHPDQ